MGLFVIFALLLIVAVAIGGLLMVVGMILLLIKYVRKRLGYAKEPEDDESMSNRQSEKQQKEDGSKADVGSAASHKSSSGVNDSSLDSLYHKYEVTEEDDDFVIDRYL